MSISKKFVIIDEVMDMLEAAKSGVVPGSVSQSVVSGIQNVPTSIVQKNMRGASAGSYTTFPLSPIVKNCCIDETFLNFEFDINYRLTLKLASGATAENDKTYTVPYWIGLRDTASMFNQIQVLIENTAIWSTVYHREESVVAYNALPETEIRGNNQYASIEKMQKCLKSPMKRFVATFTGVDDSSAADGNGKIAAGETTGSLDVTHHFKCTVDLNRLTPLISNLHFTTPHMGNLRLKVFLQEFGSCMFFCPDYGYYAFIPGNAVTSTVPLALATGNSYTDAAVNTAVNATIAGLQAPGTTQPIQNQYWSFYPLIRWANKAIDKGEIPFWYIDSNRGYKVADEITFSDIDDKNFLSFANNGIAEIVQRNFEIKGEEYERLTNYFASTGSVIIPTQTWSTSVFNLSGLSAGGSLPTSMVGNVGGYNINFITMFFHPNGLPAYFSNEYLNNFQMILDGRPINPIPYEYMNDKCIVDMTQAIIDTDHEEINQDFMNSLTFLNDADEKYYLAGYRSASKDIGPISAHALYGSGLTNSSIKRASLKNPATCMYNFSTNLPDAFHSGACILENSNRQAVIRVVSQSALDNGSALGTDNTSFPAFYNHKTDDITAGFTCFCDACIVLNFDASRNTCFDGQLSWASPYLD